MLTPLETVKSELEQCDATLVRLRRENAALEQLVQALREQIEGMQAEYDTVEQRAEKAETKLRALGVK